VSEADPEAPAAEPGPDLLARFERLNDLHVFLFYLGVSMIVTFPAIFRMTTHVIGDNASDVWKHVWGLWWVKTSMLAHFRFPLATSDINAPYGGSLYCIDPLNALLSVPLQLFMPLTMAFDLLVMFQLALGAFAAFQFVRYLGGSRACAIPAGIVYGFSPYILAYPVTSGVSETLNIAWIPFSLLYWLKTLREGTKRNALRLAICVFMTVFSSFYYGAFLMVLLLVITVGAAIGQLFAWLRADRDRRRSEIRQVLRHGSACVAGTLLGLFMAGLPVYSFFYTIRQTDSIIPPYVSERTNVEGEYHKLIAHNYSTLASYFTPGKDELESTYTADRLSRTSYLGYTVLLWVALGVFAGGWAIRAGLLMVFFMLVSLGPFMVVSEGHSLGRSPIYLLLFKLPLFASIAIPYRMSLMVYLFAAVVMAFGLRRVLRAQPLWLQNLLGLAIALQVLLEFAIASPAPYPAPLAPRVVPGFYANLAQREPERFAVLDLPPTRWNTELTPGEYFLWQTVHGKAVPYTISGTFWQSLMSNGFTRMLCYPHAHVPGGLPDPPPAAAAWLAHNGFRYVVLHTALMVPDDVAAYDAVLTRYLGSGARVPTPDDEGLHVYRVPR
jgi:hypothetical protein